MSVIVCDGYCRGVVVLRILIIESDFTGIIRSLLTCSKPRNTRTCIACVICTAVFAVIGSCRINLFNGVCCAYGDIADSFCTVNRACYIYVELIFTACRCWRWLRCDVIVSVSIFNDIVLKNIIIRKAYYVVKVIHGDIIFQVYTIGRFQYDIIVILCIVYIFIGLSFVFQLIDTCIVKCILASVDNDIFQVQTADFMLVCHKITCCCSVNSTLHFFNDCIVLILDFNRSWAVISRWSCFCYIVGRTVGDIGQSRCGRTVCRQFYGEFAVSACYHFTVGND